jgi:hypothetical protein
MIENYREIKITNLVKADWNYKKDDEHKKEKLKENIKRNGQIENIIIRPLDTGFYEVVNGNHRFEALKELGMETAICYDLGNISQRAAMRIAIETNETKFDTDQVSLAELIKEIVEEFPIDELELTMPYSDQDLENYIKLTEFDWSQFDKDKVDIDYKNGQFIVSFIADDLNKINSFLQEKGIDRVMQEGERNVKIKI